QRKILITVGAGGVGKTTTAAALGLLGAARSRRTLVLTIDPARRLAVSLGLDTLDNEARPLPPEKLDRAGLPKDRFFAMMLDAKRTFDEVIARHAIDDTTSERVRKNKLYRELSTRLAGGQEYAAMEKLHELVTSGQHDLTILDTPPMANALDFLDAPKKMVDLIDGAAVRLLVHSYEATGKLSFKLLTFGGRYVFKRLARFVGGAFLDDLAEFFADMHAMLDGFHDRAAEVTKLLRGDDVGFVIVTSPDERAVNQAVLFYERLVADGYPLAAFIINRVHPLEPPAPVGKALREALANRGVADDLILRLAPVLSNAFEKTQALAEGDARAIAELREACGEEHLYVEIPLLDDDVHDIDSLLDLAAYLVA
ncbi:MAG: ArsA family ATPase, partial [Deltaproteobacteria bacterium]|nr:ArsA family ATPase [Deltaproteobacteria bacterium]